MQPEQVLVQVGGTVVPGLVLKWRRDRAAGFVTYELGERMHTEWISVERLTPTEEQPWPPPADDVDEAPQVLSRAPVEPTD